MALVIKADLHRKTRLRLGFLSNRWDWGQRWLRLEGMSKDDDGIVEAISAIVAGGQMGQMGGALGNFHHNIASLPLAYVDAFKDGSETGWARCVYMRTRWSLPTRPPTEIASTRYGYEYLSVYRDTTVINEMTGLPAGPMQGLSDSDLRDDKKEPTPWQWKRGTVKIFVPTVTATNPYADAGGDLVVLQGAINDASILFAGFEFPAFSVRFEGANTDWIDSATDGPGIRFVVGYVFEVLFPGWYRQRAFFNDTAGVITPPNMSPPVPPGQWGTVDEVAYPTGEFTDAFPVG